MTDEKVRTIYSGDVDDWIGTGLLGLLLALGASALIFLIVAVTCSARSSGSPDYCVIAISKEHAGVVPSFRLWAHRPWSIDMMVGVFPTFTDAASASERIACPFRAAP